MVELNSDERALVLESLIAERNRLIKFIDDSLRMPLNENLLAVIDSSERKIERLTSLIDKLFNS